jgi:NAD(P)-dependent dehydrogenase (short-subunit alcohol dehydrogenase family)
MKPGARKSMQEAVHSRFDARSTAEQVISGVDLTGRLAVVTGGAAGLGKETARALAAAGADVVIAGRNTAVLEAAVEELQAAARGRILGADLDLLSLKSVADFADRLAAMDRAVDLLILNAAIMACPLARSPEGIESQLATNYVGHALLTSRLAPALLKAPAARVIALSSNAHQMSPVVFEDINYDRRPYDAWEAYSQSKTATCLLAVQVRQDLGPRGVTAHTLHPGGVLTGLLKHVSSELAAELSERYQFDASVIEVKSVAQGAATTVWAATEPALHDRPALYLEDCQVAPLLTKPNYVNGVMPYALDGEKAAALWRAAEQMIGAQMPLRAG